MAEARTKDQAIQKIGELIKDIKLAMLTTVDADGTLHSRPMAAQTSQFEGTLFFLTGKNSHKLDELRNDSHVNVAYANPDDNQWVSVSGTATASHDQQKIDELWSPFRKAWFLRANKTPAS
jgi:general stress protein 26